MTRPVLREESLPALYDAQAKAVKLDYQAWVSYMRDKYKFQLALSMARHMGFAKPGLHFYHAMRQEGFKRIKATREARKEVQVSTAVSELRGL